MAKIEGYSLERQKSLGAFYTPPTLANYLAKVTLSLAKLDKAKKYFVLDPATGESALLHAFLSESKKKGVQTCYVGIDIEKTAIQRSNKSFSSNDINNSFIQCDALYPYSGKKTAEGWTMLAKKYFPNGIDFIVSNPPWGADKSSYIQLSSDFLTAIGQFDIYDLFIELCVNNLNVDGCFGLIVPDSIYSEEHKPIREFLLKNAEIKQIVRLGEGIFPDINIAVSLIFGVKKVCNNRHNVLCAHLSNDIKKKVIKGEISLEKAIKLSSCKISSKLMVDNNYAFFTDITTNDSNLTHFLNNCQKIGDVTSSQRGIELSKKGIILKCPICQKWLPEPKGKENKDIKCPHCKYIGTKSSFLSMGIISTKVSKGYKKIIVGEDVYRFRTNAKQYIKIGVQGINYKDAQLYQGSKILVRKTGVGITAGIDYDNSLTNQVVYIIKRRNDIDPIISNEVILAVLNSRITTYFIIKTMGSNGWKTHAYLSQASVASLPFPNIDVNNAETRDCLMHLTDLVKNNARVSSDNFSIDADAKIERIVAKLFGINQSDYEVIYKAINEVQQMIPFRRLLRITAKDIFNNGI
ncbi:MAG: N-6 DNA methylase [Segatella oris]|jgi:hypothetical protein